MLLLKEKKRTFLHSFIANTGIAAIEWFVPRKSISETQSSEVIDLGVGNLVQSQVHKLLFLGIREGHVHNDFVVIVSFAFVFHSHIAAFDDFKCSKARITLKFLGDVVLHFFDSFDLFLAALLLLTYRKKFEGVDLGRTQCGRAKCKYFL